MAAVIIRNLPDDTHRALKQRAKQHGRSTEAEMREILTAAVRPADNLKIGTELAKLGREIGFDQMVERDRTPPKPASFD
jgi:Plasmid stability protein